MLKKVSFFALLAIFLMCLFCTGCSSEPKVDTSSDQTFVQSMAEIYKTLPETERDDFGKYFMATIAGEIKGINYKNIKEDEYGKLYSMIKSRGGENAEKYLAAINGMTAKQIQEKGKGIWKSHFEERLTGLKTRLAEMKDGTKETPTYRIEAVEKEIEELEAELTKLAS